MRLRLMDYGRTIKDRHKHLPNHREVDAIMKPVLSAVTSCFEGIVGTRGSHVHTRRYTDEESDRLGLFVFAQRLKAASKEHVDEAVLEFRRKWLKTMRENLQTIDNILEFYFEAVSKCLFDSGCLFDTSKLPSRP